MGSPYLKNYILLLISETKYEIELPDQKCSYHFLIIATDFRHARCIIYLCYKCVLIYHQFRIDIFHPIIFSDQFLISAIREGQSLLQSDR